MASKRHSANEKANYKRYATEGREEINRLIKLERHVKNSPNDDIASARLAKLKKDGVPHRRKKPRGKLHQEPAELSLEEKVQTFNYNKKASAIMNKQYYSALKFRSLFNARIS